MDKLPDYNWKPGSSLDPSQLNTIVSTVNEIDADKQDPIIDLNTIREDADSCKDKVQPDAIKNMQTKTDATKVYATKTALSALVKTKQDVIDNLDEIRNNAAEGSTAIQPSDIVGMQKKTDANNNYALLTDYNTQRGIADNLLNPSPTTDVNDMEYLQGYSSTGALVQISIDNYEKTKLFLKAWGVIINPNDSSPELETVGDYTYWESFKENIGRYLLTNAGKAIKLSKTDSSIAIDGTTIDETIGHVMVRIPQLYYNVVSNEDGSYTLWMSKYDIGGHLMPEIWVGAYLAYLDGTKLTSRSESEVGLSRDQTITEFFNSAQANGSDFGLEDYNFRRAMMMIYLSEYHNLNCQSSLGVGMSGSGGNWGSGAEGELTGRTKTFGDSCGKVLLTDLGITTKSDDTCHVSLFGIEDPYGWYSEITQGVYYGNPDNNSFDDHNKIEIFIYEGNRLPTSSELTTHPDGEYRKLAIADDCGWIKTIIAGPYFDLFPSTLGGSSSTYWCDYSGVAGFDQLAIWGGYARRGLRCGLSLSDSFKWDMAYYEFRTRLAYYGSPTIVQKYEELS